MKKHFFKTFEFEFETARLLWYSPNGGSDYSEVATTTEKIKDGDYESWYKEWSDLAEKLEQRSNTFASAYNKACGYLRASRYYQAAEFFLSPKDYRKIEAYQKSVALFYKSLDLQKVKYISENIDYGHAKMRTLLFRTWEKPKGIIFICGGFDALLEELYFTNVNYGLANGYDVVLYEGPGQSDMIRKHHFPFEENWNNVASKVINFYIEKYKLAGEKIGIGLSLGGLLIARAASLDQSLFDKIVLYNYFPSMLDSFKKSMPKFLYRYIDNGFPAILEKACSLYISKNKFLNWQIEHAKWTFGEKSLNDLLKKCRKFNEELSRKNLETDTLILLAENENYYDFRLGLDFFDNIPSQNKKLVLFNKTSFSSDLHCQNGAAYDANDVIFEWLNSPR